MKLSVQNASLRGFGLNQLVIAIIAIGIFTHYAGPSIKRMTSTAESKASSTKEGVTELFSRRF